MSEYGVKLKDVVLTSEESDLILPTGKLPQINMIRRLFSRNVNGNLQIKRHKTSGGVLKVFVYCSECQKQYKLQLLLDGTNADDRLKINVSTQEENACQCSKKTIQVRGQDREILKTKLQNRTPSQIYSESYFQPLKDENPPPPKVGTLKTALHELRSQSDLDPKDELNDVFLRYRSKQLNNIAEISVYKVPSGERFHIILTSDHAVEVAQKFLMEKSRFPFKRLLLDATGKITARVNDKAILHHVLLAPILKQESEICFLVPVGEMITDDQTGENIGHFLRFILNRFTVPALKRLKQIGTDDSWANVHAIFSLTPGMTVTKYLKLSYDVFMEKSASTELLSCVAPAYCFSHFSKNWRNDINAAYKDFDTRQTVRAVLTEMTTIADVEFLKQFINAFIILLLSQRKTKILDAARVILRAHSSAKSPEKNLQDQSQPISTNLTGKALYKDSPFFQHFNNAIEKFELNPAALEGTEENKFFCKSLLDKILKHYLPYLPFWTIFISRIQDSSATRSNNARVERFFLSLKDDCVAEEKSLSRLGSIKVGRYIEFRSKKLENLLNEIDAEGLSHKLTNQPRKSTVSRIKVDPAFDQNIEEKHLSQQEEHWDKKRRSKYGERSKKLLKAEFGDCTSGNGNFFSFDF